MEQNKSSIATKLKSFFGFGAEGSYRGPATGWSELGNPFPIAFGDGFQRNLTMDRNDPRNATAFACRSTISQAVGMLPFNIKFKGYNGKIEDITTSDAYRVLQRPNPFQTSVEFYTNAVDQLLACGNFYAIAQRNERGAISALYPLPVGHCEAYIAPSLSADYSEGSVFYNVSKNIFGEAPEGALVPARDILHLKIHSDPRNIFRGRSPLEFAASALGLHNVIEAGLGAFHANKSRPSGFLSSSQNLNAEQITRLRAAWESVSAAWSQGLTPVLGGDLKFVPMSDTNATDMQLIQLLAKTDLDVCRVFRVPPELIGLNSAQAPRSVEELNRLFLSQSLGYILEVLEQGLSQLFNLKMPDAWIECDTSYLLRTDPKTKFEGYATAIRAGIFSINEIRLREGEAGLPGCDEVYLQQQDIPASLASEFATTTMQRMRAETSRNNPTNTISVEPKKKIPVSIRKVEDDIRALMDKAGIPRTDDSKPRTPEANALLQKCINRAQRVVIGLDNGTDE
jgi:HK97 family phage portal protein